jgi:hypothetical protein
MAAMAETRATASVWDIRAGDIALKRAEGRRHMYLELGPVVYVGVGSVGAEALEAAAMRKLAEVAAEAAEELERRAAAKVVWPDEPGAG